MMMNGLFVSPHSPSVRCNTKEITLLHLSNVCDEKSERTLPVFIGHLRQQQIIWHGHWRLLLSPRRKLTEHQFGNRKQRGLSPVEPVENMASLVEENNNYATTMKRKEEA